MHTRQQMLLTLVNSVVIIWIIWIITAEFTRVIININNIHIIQIMGKRGEEVAVKETIEESAQGQRVGNNKVMQVLQKLQAPRVKHLNQAASI